MNKIGTHKNSWELTIESSHRVLDIKPLTISYRTRKLAREAKKTFKFMEVVNMYRVRESTFGKFTLITKERVS